MCLKPQDYDTTASSSTLVCQHCTYLNPPGRLYCEICNNRIRPPDDEEEDNMEDCHGVVYEDDDGYDD